MPRHQPPVHSPLSLGALVAGSRTLADGSDGARRRVQQRIRETFAPVDLLLTDSGTSALMLALRAAGDLYPDRPVALPAYCCYDVATAAEGAGLSVELYDLDPRTLSPDAASLAEALQRGARTVVLAHLYGMPADLPTVDRLCRDAGALLVEDAAQAAGGRLGETPIGSVGSLSILSFGRGKGTTGGGGGALLANDDEGREVLASVRSELRPRRGGVGVLARTAAQWLMGRPEVYALPASLPWLSLGETVHRSPTPARECPEACLGILSETWRLAESELEVRREHARHLRRSLAGHGELSPVRPFPAARPGYLRLPVLASARVRELAGKTEAERLGIMPGYPRPLGELPEFSERCRNADVTFRGAADLAGHLFTFPTHGRLEPGDLRRLDRWIERAGRPG